MDDYLGFATSFHIISAFIITRPFPCAVGHHLKFMITISWDFRGNCGLHRIIIRFFVRSPNSSVKTDSLIFLAPFSRLPYGWH